VKLHALFFIFLFFVSNSIYLSYFFVTVAFMCIFAALGITIRNFTSVALWIPIVGMIMAFLFVMLVFVVPYFELVFANVYLELKKNNTEAKVQNSTKQTQNKTNITTKKRTTNGNTNS